MLQLTQQKSFSLKPLLQQVQQPEPSILHESNDLASLNQQQHQPYPKQQQQQQQQQHSFVPATEDGSDPFAENRAKKAAKRDKFLGRERQQMQLEQLRALVSEPKLVPSASSSAGAEEGGVRTIANSSGGWGVKVSGASFFCKAADEAATQWQVKLHAWQRPLT